MRGVATSTRGEWVEGIGMAKTKAKKETKAPEQTEEKKPVGHDPGERAVQWVQQRQRPLIAGMVGLIVLVGGAWFLRSAQIRREAFAERELATARFAAESGNLQLAATDLSRVSSTYGKTKAGQEAAILLARVRLQQDEDELAVGELRTFLDGGPDNAFVAPAEGLLGSAYEELGRFAEAADAYERAANAWSRYGLLSERYLLDAGRAASLAGDSAKAATAYQRIIDEADEDSPSLVEAQLRLAEVLKGSLPS